MKTLTIVVPAYNVERYLTHCLDSVKLEKVLPELEILIVNDGSKDRTAEIAAAYESAYPETYRLITKENGGHGSAINTGIREAKGKYFKVVDGDDWLNTEELEEYLEILRTHEEDLIATDFRSIEDETYRPIKDWKATSKETHYGRTVRLDSGEITDPIKLHSFTIRTEILQKHAIVLDEHCFYVDSELVFYPVPYIETVYYHPATLYMYRLGRAGQSMQLQSMQRNIRQHRLVLTHLLEAYDRAKENMSPGKRAYLERSISLIVEMQFLIYISMGLKKGTRSECKAWDRELKEKYPAIYGAAKKKSIDWIRRTDYRLLPVGAVAVRVRKK